MTEDDDPGVFDKICLLSDDLPPFTGGREIFNEIEMRVKNKGFIDDVINAPEDVVAFFGKVFPEIQKHHNVGLNSSADMKIWKNGENEISIEEDKSPSSCPEDSVKWDVYVGGPATLFGAVIQARSEKRGNLLYVHDGIRGVSNWKGSLCTYIQRDSLPLYYYSGYSAPSVIFSTVRDALHRLKDYSGYINRVKTDPYWSTLRLSFSNLFSSPSFIWMSMRNQIKAFLDVGLYLPGTAILPSHKTTAHTSFPHVCLTPKLLHELELNYPVYIGNSERSTMINGYFGEIKKKPRFIDSERRLAQIIGPEEYIPISADELATRGYDTNVVVGGQVRLRDGTIHMASDVQFEEDIIKHGGVVQSDSRLVKILVKPAGNSDCEVTRVVWENPKTGEQSITKVNTLNLSLGPSMDKLKVVSGKKSWLGKLLQENNLLEQIMCAAAATTVFLVKVDKTVVPEYKLQKFRDITGYSNKIYYRLGEREVDVDGKPHHFFAMQCSGGGMFPSKHAHAEAALNTFRAIISPTLSLESEGVEYEILSMRSCARGVTAHNFMRLTAPAANMVMIYGLGGTGMANMVPHAVLMSAVMRQRQLLAAGKITVKEFKRILTTSTFDHIPFLGADNPFKGNYYPFFDIGTHKTVARSLFGSRADFLLQRMLKFTRFLK